MGDGYVHYVDCDYCFMATCILILKIIQKYTLNMLTAFSYTSIKLLKQKNTSQMKYVQRWNRMMQHFEVNVLDANVMHGKTTLCIYYVSNSNIL